MSTLTERIEQQTQQCLNHASPLFSEAGVDMPNLAIKFNLKGLCAGQAVLNTTGMHAIRYNLAIANKQPEAFIQEVVPHEVAHIICYSLFGKVRPHGKEWKAIMRYLGIEKPQTYHQLDVDKNQIKRQRRWLYHCACQTHEITTTRHYRIIDGTQSYSCRNCGEAIQLKKTSPH